MMVMRLLDKTSGDIVFDGEDIGSIPAAKFAVLPQRKRIQMVFQDPTDSLNPRFTAARAIADPIMRLGGISGRDALRARCEELAKVVGLPLGLLDRFPHQLSGGQKARVGIARAIALNPELVILDEPTAALDVSVQAPLRPRDCDAHGQDRGRGNGGGSSGQPEDRVYSRAACRHSAPAGLKHEGNPIEYEATSRTFASQ
jgi:ABC-type proline/glycine betaine transport system ATPase subunit